MDDAALVGEPEPVGDLVEQVRRFSGEVGSPGGLVALTLLNLPRGIYGILPLICIIAAVWLFLALARSSELVAARGAGRSALRSLAGPVLVALLLGALAVAALNPVVAATSREYEARVGRIDGGRATALAQDALWLRQAAPGGEGQTVIRAARSSLDGTELGGATFLDFADGRPVRRIEAARARLRDGAWTLTDARAWDLAAPNPEATARAVPLLSVPSDLTPEGIRDAFAVPSSIPIWELAAFIRGLEEAGFAARRHRVFLQTELALPLFLAATVLIAACFTIHHPRGRRTGVNVLLAVLTGFAAYILRNVSQVLGESGQLPPALAAWAPPLVAILLALAWLLHLEEG